MTKIGLLAVGDVVHCDQVDEEVYHQQEASLKQLSEGFDAVAGKTGEKVL